MKNILTFLFSFFLLVSSAKAASNFYYGIGTGLNFSPDTSNDHQLEFGSEPSHSVLISFGQNYENWKYRVEFDARRHNFHGHNNMSGNFTLDGEKLAVYGVSFGVFVKYANFSLGPIVGYSMLDAFDKKEFAWFTGAEVSYEYKLDDSFSVELGYRYYKWEKLSNFGNMGKLAYDTHGSTLRFIVRP